MIYAIVTVLVLIADQAVKFWTTKNIVLDAVNDACAKLIPGFVHMTNVHNTGAAFGILQDGRWPLVAVSAVFVLVIIILIGREVIHTPFGKWTAVLVMAGAIGNCIDRVLYGYVVDIFEFEFSLFGRPFSFPVFNVADIFITVCGILFCIHILFHNEPEAVRNANAPEFVRKRREEQRKQEAAAAARAAKARPARAAAKPAPEARRREAPAKAADPLDIWELGGTAEAASAPGENAARRSRGGQERPAPDRRRKSSPPEPELSPLPEDDPVYGEEKRSSSFNLEDILAEFEDL